MDAILQALGIVLLGASLTGLNVLFWRAGTVRQPKRTEVPSQLRDAKTYRDRVGSNLRRAMGQGV